MQFGVRQKTLLNAVSFEVTAGQILQLKECLGGNWKTGNLKITQINFQCRDQKPYLSMSIMFITGSAANSALTNNETSIVVWRPTESVEGI